MSEVTFKRSTRDHYRYLAFKDDVYIGFVTKKEAWTVRGTRIYWEARCSSKYIGQGSTRKEAGLLLVS